jgi:hypothetical protein
VQNQLFRNKDIERVHYKTLTQCRLEIMKNYHEIDYSVQLPGPEIALNFVEKEIDSKIEFCIQNSKEKNEDWTLFSEAWTDLEPFINMKKGGTGKVYVIQCKETNSHGWKRVYVGSTWKELDKRYAEHIDPKKHQMDSTTATKNHYIKDPTIGFRWDLMTKYHDEPYFKIGFKSKNKLRFAEWKLSNELNKSGFEVLGDWGQYGRNR